MTVTQTATDEFTEFYSANFRPIASQLYAYLGDHAEAQDVTQEAFCRAFGRWDRLRDYENAGGWVRLVAWNLATSRLRHLKAAVRYLSRQRPAHVEPPGPERVDLTRALATLPANHRLAIVLHHLGQLSTSEIAEQRGVAEGTVRSWLSRGRSQLAEYFLDTDGWESPDFKPEGAQAAVTAARKRRVVRRTAIAAAVLVVALLAPLTLLALQRHSQPPVIGPSKPPIVHTPQTTVEPRKLSMPGVSLDSMPTMNYLDSQRAWTWHSTCWVPAPPPVCGTVAVRTNDGGLTWHEVKMPLIDARLGVKIHEIDHDIFVVETYAEGVGVSTAFWLTKDGGATWTPSAATDPPAELLKSQPRYGMVCNDGPNLLSPASSCDRPVLVDYHENRVVAAQPPVQGESSYVLQGSDGRIWLTDNDLKPPKLFYSGDGGTTWREQPLPPNAKPHDPAFLQLSPDGSQVWLNGYSGLWKLVGQRWEQWLDWPMEWAHPNLIGNDLWVMVYNDGNYRYRLAYFQNGRFTIVEGLDQVAGSGVLPDGTIVSCRGDLTCYLGIGTGMDRRWVHLTT